MRKDPSKDVAAVTRRRLEQLGRQLAEAGVTSAGPDQRDPGPGPVAPVLVSDPGRHARGRTLSVTERLVARAEEHLPGPLRGRVALRAAHLGFLAFLLAAAVGIAAWTTLRASPPVAPVPVAHTTRAPEPSTSAHPIASTDPPTTSVPSPASATVLVDVAGKVRHPGVTTLPAGSRVIDALRKAGGARRGVDLSGLNLARVLLDGEQILVGTGPPAAAPSSAGSAGAGVPVSLNSAGLDQLDTLPGVGPVTAQKIIDWRTRNGSFSAVDELLEVDGIGAKTFAELSPHVTL